MTCLANFFIFLCLVTANALSIEKVSEKNNVTKRQAEFFPDWVPFKNKHGEELGEFVSVPKTKVKKRLAPPVNFILRAVAESEGDDYYDKGQGESDSDDYYEKKEWSDLNRPVETTNITPVLNHTDISDIDGVLGIITTKPDIDVSEIQIPYTKNTTKQNESKETYKDEVKEEKKKETSSKESNKDSSEEKSARKQSEKKYEEEADYEESDVDKRKPEVTEEEQSESDAKKARILDAVDELKERHAEEQRAINEKVKEEELYKEEQERNNLGHNPAAGKYEPRSKYKKASDYEEYEDGELSIHDKYKMNPFKETVPTTRQPRKTRKPKIKNKKEEVGKLSVFKNPQLYMIYDDDTSEETSTERTSRRPKSTTTPTTTTTGSTKHTRFSSRYTTSTVGPEAEESVRISLVPQGDQVKEGEPRLFFPKTRKNKRKRKNKKTSAEPDSHVAETKKATASGLTTAPEFTGTSPDITGTGIGVTSSGTTGTSGVTRAGTGSTARASAGGLDASVAGSDTTALETAPSAGAAVTDALPASSDHKKHENKDSSHEKGGERQYKSEHHEQHEEHGKKAYEGVHKDTKTAKGHHDKENHLDKYEDHGGHDKHHEIESGHYGDHHHEEHGKKHAKYEESGKHSKGHSTKGSHDIHKKDEYEKKVEFFEEEGDSAEEEKHGGYKGEKSHKAGGHFGKGNHQAEHHQHHKGDAGHFQKGGHGHGHKPDVSAVMLQPWSQADFLGPRDATAVVTSRLLVTTAVASQPKRQAGHRSSGGHDGHGKQGQAHFQEEDKKSGKKWIYHHGHPAKTANLVVIDRRADQYYHGPHYYG